MRDVVSLIPGGSAHSRLGTVITVSGERKVNVDGSILTCTWADPMIVDDGDPVNVEFRNSGNGGAKAHVSSRAASQPRPRTALVTQVPVGAATIRVQANGVSYDAEPVGGSYSAGDYVHLDWGAGRPRVIGRVSQAEAATSPIVTAPPPALPQGPRSGYQSRTALASRTLRPVSGWGSWAEDGAMVYQGNFEGRGDLTGAWFYGDRFTNMAGRTITRVQFKTGQRLNVGASTAPVVFSFYAHTNSSEPSGDTNRVLGPFQWTAQPGQGPTRIDLPVEFGAVLAAGGGISIYGGAYAGMQGVTPISPESGSLILDWTY